MKESEIIEFLKKNIEPLKDENYGDGYRAAAHLKDGTFLPCVMFRNSKNIIELAKRRFKQERRFWSKQIGYNNIIKNFVVHGNRINIYDIAAVEESKCAFPLPILKQIHGETIMAWTAFAVKMKDGKYFGFGTSYFTEFFQMPKGYSIEDIAEIINHSIVLPNGELQAFKHDFSKIADLKNFAVYRECPFFECYIESFNDLS